MQRNLHLMMRIILTILAFTFISFGAAAQPEPVRWSFSLDTVAGNRLQVIAEADIDAGWKLYAHNIDEGGPIPTDLVIEEEKNMVVAKKIGEAGNIHGPEVDDIFEVTVSYFTHNATFSREIEPRDASSVSGYVLYMVCDDSRCLPPREVPFTLKL